MNCNCKVESADLHIAGTPCTDFSARGHQLGLEGPTTGLLFCWLILRILLQDKYVLQENVVSFVTDVIAAVLGRLYFIDQIVLDAKCLGWPVSRKRKYTLLRHRYKTGTMAQPLNVFSKLFLQDPVDVQPAWQIFFVAGPRELREELLWAAQRPSSTWNDSPESGLLVPAMCLERDGSEVNNSYDGEHGIFWQVLTDSERSKLRQFQKLAPGQIFQLNQDPDVTAPCSSNSHMFTIIKNAGVLWQLVSSVKYRSQV